MEIVVNISDMKVTNRARDVLVTHALGSCLGLAAYDPVARTLSQFAKGRGIGDCGVFQTWTWTAHGFVLSHEAAMGECWGVPSELWPTRWRSRTD